MVRTNHGKRRYNSKESSFKLDTSWKKEERNTKLSCEGAMLATIGKTDRKYEDWINNKL